MQEECIDWYDETERDEQSGCCLKCNSSAPGCLCSNCKCSQCFWYELEWDKGRCEKKAAFRNVRESQFLKNLAKARMKKEGPQKKIGDFYG